MCRIWDKLEMYWHIPVDGGMIGLTELKERMRGFLTACEVFPVSFSHAGAVVRNAGEYIAKLSDDLGEDIVLNDERVETAAYNVYRLRIEGKELELIEPVGECFFRDFLLEHGETLQHISYRVHDIDGCFLRVSGNRGVLGLIDKKPRAGVHGQIAFVKPAFCAPLCLELTEHY